MSKTHSLRHLGIIADGNRRWAKENGLPKSEGHRIGFSRIEDLVLAASDCGIDYITFYVFSTENWGREEAEVNYLMALIEKMFLSLAKKMVKQNIRMLVLGTKTRLSPKLVSLVEKAEKMTAECTGTTACFCFNYGGEQEIADAATIAQSVEGEITPETIRKHLYHPEVPNVDMVVRTSGEERISGFMLWRSAYAEFYFIDKFFPEMGASDIKDILKEYEKRNRRFGK